MERGIFCTKRILCRANSDFDSSVAPFPALRPGCRRKPRASSEEQGGTSVAHLRARKKKRIFAGLIGAFVIKPTAMATGNNPPPKRKLLTRWEAFMLIIVALIILYVVLQQFGVDLIYQESNEELLHRPHGD
jgi:hypothetical protein